MIPLVDLKSEYEKLRSNIQKEINKVIEDSSFILGSNGKEIESKISRYTNTKYGIGVGSGTDALLIALESLKIGKNDEVITTPFTFFATAEVITRVGATPVFVDIDPKTYNINPELIEKAITKKTKAIIVVHLFGQPADMDPIMKIAEKHNLKVIEDACQSIGAVYKGRKTGSIGDAGCYSFFPSKNLGAYGDGGIIVTDNEEICQNAKLLRNHGSTKKYEHKMIGINSRLDELQAAILKVKFNMLEEWNIKRREIAKKYTEELNGIVNTPFVEKESLHVFHQYCIQTKCRDQLSSFLKKKNIATAVYYPIPLHLQPVYKYLQYKQNQFPFAEKVSKNILALPIFPMMTEEQQKYIVSSIKEFLGDNYEGD
ncbi:DegT/DnrJ/EryC1/StrS family aminotransferase [Alteribacillus sp. JSM 102045]|uniref:DegT/DnrJ/EryC1/StrS family aminotransferase n=1 Tax=Alteribacillus sp. JSM 102045 TaxID=1562101 RepID=UPI0035BF6E99